MKYNKCLSFLVFSLFLNVLATSVCHAQFTLYDSVVYNPTKLKKKIVWAGSLYTVGLLGLNEVWYKENPRQRFSFFNDAHEWKQVDKVGHFYSSFYISALSSRSLNNAGIQPRKAAALGAATGWLAISAIEILDGHSAAYGASASDLLANFAGSSFYYGQILLWRDIRIYPKFSFSPTSLAHKRPNVLGDNLASQMLKDYNGQTYWLSVDVDKFTKFPKWLNVAVGYGAQNMIYANDASNQQAGYNAYRQYYLAVDIDLTGIKTRSKFVKGLLILLSGVRLPAPALAFNRGSARFYPLYF
ncbi:MAG: DUF2279 domain-containing protein [Cyclobacteriaceae bacterium]|jgi:uncharacterized protein YfiM (DUF2279 family)|nr:DUF2279 domain-containing protein [Cytophagales bacterium]MCZ8327850.1 DUF2279 domain-containing protein [Cyclobacteriaceae bacterium]